MIINTTIKETKIYKIDPVKIRVERARKNWTKSKLSIEAGIARKTLSQIENGTAKNTTFSTIEKIATALGKTIEDFIEK